MVLNTTGKVREDVAYLGDCDADYLTDEGGTLYPVQQTAEGAVAFLRDIPSKGYRMLRAGVRRDGQQPAESAFVLSDKYTLETPFYKVSFAENGEIARLYDKENDREVVQPGKTLNQFLSLIHI